eukprot:CAMPEP_0202700904 /NCGR_PEP_ID=MMETSP1385-20130828/14037_1 /ASSEMBLY_ACC=CAM_ASM_000861 /TAXON_ID=933848 /ORGANISM="Elphidium margaritaceum" /LENGTH=505 /DNA_ID=CAMNT_0049358195 /DNA_START=73 /DNA_END=1590 /DNA_ORIENTATION=-
MGGGSSSGSSGTNDNHGGSEWFNAAWEDHPYMVRLRMSKNGYTVCGGSIISLNGYGGKGVVLTAAHCVNGISSVDVYVGQSTVGSGGTTYSGASYLVHPSYSLDPIQNDVALIFLNSAIDHRGASAIQLHSSIAGIVEGEAIKLLGYYGKSSSAGNTCAGCSDTDTLEWTWGHFISKSTCERDYDSSMLNDGDICMDDMDATDGLTSTCGGDSGSPAVYEGREIGLVSWGVVGCDPTKASVFANVAHFYSWIESNCAGCLSYQTTYASQYYGCGGVGAFLTGCKGTDYVVQHPNANSARYIKKLCIWHGGLIDAVQAWYNDGATSGKKGGGGGGMECYDAGQRCFTSVMIKSGSKIDALQFTLSDGAKTKQFGGSGGDGPFHENSDVYGYCLSKINFRAGDTLHQVSFTWTDVDMDNVAQAYEIEEISVTDASNITVIVAISLCVCALLACLVCLLLRRRNKKHMGGGDNRAQVVEDEEEVEDEEDVEVEAVEVEVETQGLNGTL